MANKIRKQTLSLGSYLESEKRGCAERSGCAEDGGAVGRGYDERADSNRVDG